MKKTTRTTIIICLLMGLALGAVGWLTTGFSDFSKEAISDKFDKPVNEDNLYTAECMTLKDTNDGSGIIIKTNEDGSFKVEGIASSAATYEIGTVILNKGTYTLTAVSGGSKNTVYVSAEIGSITVNADFTGNTFEIAADNTEVTLVLNVAADTEVNKTVYPVIVPGTESGKFYK